jgi:hypothetical protein
MPRIPRPRSSVQRFRFLVESAPASIGVTREGRCVHANRTDLALFGAADPASQVGRAVLETVPAEGIAVVRHRERASLSTLGFDPDFILRLAEFETPTGTPAADSPRRENQFLLFVSPQRHVSSIVSTSLRTLGFNAQTVAVRPDGGALVLTALGDLPIVLLRSDDAGFSSVARGITLHKRVRMPDLAERPARLLREQPGPSDAGAAAGDIGTPGPTRKEEQP